MGRSTHRSSGSLPAEAWGMVKVAGSDTLEKCGGRTYEVAGSSSQKSMSVVLVIQATPKSNIVPYWVSEITETSR